ncbi:unnamed protein product [Cuscuta europaea]|uniref:tRNA/rRNA methyltransferase SpoU type domain-containing protein n=1 Tax=Cuscuta europaea TaxID=41803 RepID=A0A9P0YYZ3_CUSEU|nr:unnamed protein product [Cuscuta europaea]
METETKVIESYVVVHNIAKRHNVGTLARSATAFGVSELILVGRRDFNSFGGHGSTSHLRFRHFHSLSDAKSFLKERGCDICGVEITDSARAVNQHPFKRSTAFLLGNEGFPKRNVKSVISLYTFRSMGVELHLLMSLWLLLLFSITLELGLDSLKVRVKETSMLLLKDLRNRVRETIAWKVQNLLLKREKLRGKTPLVDSLMSSAKKIPIPICYIQCLLISGRENLDLNLNLTTSTLHLIWKT